MTFDWEKNDAKEKFKNFERKRSLSWAVVEITEYCNFNCKWCFANAGENPKPVHMEKENAFRLIETLADSGVRQITFSGGEPTVYPYIADVISKAHDSGMVVHMNTNGYLMTRELAEKLKGRGLSQVQINIDSLDPEAHDYIRGRQGSHERAIQALKNARTAGLTCVSQTVLTKKNEDEIVDIFKFARSMGLQRCRVWDMTPSDGCAKENMELMPADYIATLQQLADFAHKTGGQNIEAGEPLFLKNIETDLPVSGGFCVAMAGLIINVGANGDIYFCSTNRIPLYNIFQINGKLKEVHRMKVGEYTYSLSGCKNCNISCEGGCNTRQQAPLWRDYWCNHLVFGTETVPQEAVV
ncbi:MAG: radical SAM protein [Candidatus Hydrothermarchaeaceae archaeon]